MRLNGSRRDNSCIGVLTTGILITGISGTSGRPPSESESPSASVPDASLLLMFGLFSLLLLFGLAVKLLRECCCKCAYMRLLLGVYKNIVTTLVYIYIYRSSACAVDSNATHVAFPSSLHDLARRKYSHPGYVFKFKIFK